MRSAELAPAMRAPVPTGRLVYLGPPPVRGVHHAREVVVRLRVFARPAVLRYARSTRLSVSISRATRVRVILLAPIGSEDRGRGRSGLALGGLRDRRRPVDLERGSSGLLALEPLSELERCVRRFGHCGDFIPRPVRFEGPFDAAEAVSRYNEESADGGGRAKRERSTGTADQPLSADDTPLVARDARWGYPATRERLAPSR